MSDVDERDPGTVTRSRTHPGVIYYGGAYRPRPRHRYTRPQPPRPIRRSRWIPMCRRLYRPVVANITKVSTLDLTALVVITVIGSILLTLLLVGVVISFVDHS